MICSGVDWGGLKWTEVEVIAREVACFEGAKPGTVHALEPELGRTRRSPGRLGCKLYGGEDHFQVRACSPVNLHLPLDEFGHNRQIL